MLAAALAAKATQAACVWCVCSRDMCSWQLHCGVIRYARPPEVPTICNAACCSCAPCSCHLLRWLSYCSPPPLQAPCHAATLPKRRRWPTYSALCCSLTPSFGNHGPELSLSSHGPELLLCTASATRNDVSCEAYSMYNGGRVLKLRWRKLLHNTHSATCRIQLVDTAQATGNPQPGCAVHNTYCGKRWCCSCGLNVTAGLKLE
jgi:hypothetical protein